MLHENDKYFRYNEELKHILKCLFPNFPPSLAEVRILFKHLDKEAFLNDSRPGTLKKLKVLSRQC